MKNIDTHNLEEAYSVMAGKPPGFPATKQQVKPKSPITKTFPVMSKSVKTSIPVGNDKSTKGFVQKNSGPAGADNFKSTELDPDNPAVTNDNVYRVKQLSDSKTVPKFANKSKKIAKENINTNMTKNKSIFDRLYEEVMDDELEIKELGIGDEDGGDIDELGGDDEAGENTVTITLDKDLARQLCDVLKGVVEDEDGDEDGLGDEGGDEGDFEGDFEGEEGEGGGFPEEMEETDEETDEEEENFNYFGEEIESEDLGTPLVNQRKGGSTSVKGSANVVQSTHTKSVGSKGGDSKVTNKTGDTTEGTPLVNQKKGGSTPVKGSGNVIKSKIKGGGKGDQEFFQKNS